eukprot:TRINITY_DN2849_c0_g1_i2.p1 TRINITY_DN2849_c0_g1~~TRINITY_DN2849_c0_g1_i2.p1  ORF type:complete len:365 (-),score=38.70 TRINITY_DN2849_c0_g1_i2:231-1325(-)
MRAATGGDEGAATAGWRAKRGVNVRTAAATAAVIAAVAATTRPVLFNTVGRRGAASSSYHREVEDLRLRDLPSLPLSQEGSLEACDASVLGGAYIRERGQQRRPNQDPLSACRMRSLRPGCQATLGPRQDPEFLDKVKPCGTLSSLCTDIPLVEANKDYPGGGVGAVRPLQDYVVQFDIGVDAAVAKEHAYSEDSFLPAVSSGELCMEVVVTGGAMWGNLGVTNVSAKAYDCMGGCGAGCSTPGRTADDVGALDCLKHDVCSAWKSVSREAPTTGFCDDPDCGDEAAMSIFNCWHGFRLFGSLGGSRRGPFAEPAICSREDNTKGCWNHGGWFTKGRCKVFQGWAKGQGIPDPHPFRSPIQRLR